MLHMCASTDSVLFPILIFATAVPVPLANYLFFFTVQTSDRSEIARQQAGSGCSLVQMGIQVNAEVVLLDIEGTVCSISFVKDVLFPYALQALPKVLATEWDSPEFAPYRSAFPSEHRTSPAALLSNVQDLMSKDLKIPYLKSLQGYLWLTGYESGDLRCPLFSDVLPSLRSWHKAGIPIIIYSSGSVAAQKLLFQYTNSEPNADLRGYLSGYFDTVNAGMKNEHSSYEKIALTREEPIGKWLFLSDNVKETYAAKEAGMQSFVVVREGNAPLAQKDKEDNILIQSFAEIELGKS